MTARTRWPALGTTAEVVVTEPSQLFAARVAVERELRDIDQACSRFRHGSGLTRLNAAAGQGPQAVSARLLQAITVSLDVCVQTTGAVDPTVGAGMIAAGYDRDLAAVPADGPPITAVPAPGIDAITVDRATRRVTLPAGVTLDLGATAKALAADRAAAAAQAAIGRGSVLVSLGGDVAVAGPTPDGGWAVGVSDDHRNAAAQVVSIERGGLTTSGLTVRRWRRGDRTIHHVLDPRTGEPVAPIWRTVTVTASSCVVANGWSTAALVVGRSAPGVLRAAGVAARLVDADGHVTLVGGWPPETDRAGVRRTETGRSETHRARAA